tara:strand:- start:507 stop:1223 length:717 start_codon:yes stop_codon:yes gene_type:complete
MTPLRSLGNPDKVSYDDVFCATGDNYNFNHTPSGGNYSVDFDGTNDYLVTNSSSDYTLGTGDFTFEHWVRPDDVSTTQQIIDGRMQGNSWDTDWCTYINSDGTYRFFANGDKITDSSALSANTWYHFAVCRSSGTTKMFKNGTQVGSNYSDSNNYTSTTITLAIHGPDRASYDFDGEISTLRVVIGTALYTSNFTTPTSPLESVTNTKLLCANESTVDAATVGTVTAGGDPQSTTGPF